RAVRRSVAQLVRSEAGLVADVDTVFARVPDSLGARGIPVGLLLLPRRLLQIVLGRSAFLHRKRTAQIISRREFIPAHPAERSPILPLPGTDSYSVPRARCLEGDVVRGSGVGQTRH